MTEFTRIRLKSRHNKQAPWFSVDARLAPRFRGTSGRHFITVIMQEEYNSWIDTRVVSPGSEKAWAERYGPAFIEHMRAKMPYLFVEDVPCLTSTTPSS